MIDTQEGISGGGTGSGAAREQISQPQPGIARLVIFGYRLQNGEMELRSGLITKIVPGSDSITIRVFSPESVREEMFQALYSEKPTVGCWSWPQAV